MRGRTSVDLSHEQRQAMVYAARGLTAAQAAKLVGKSPETVKRQREAALRRLGAHTLAQAVFILTVEALEFKESVSGFRVLREDSSSADKERLAPHLRMWGA